MKMDKNELQKRLGIQIKKAMAEKKISHAELSKRSEIDPPHITRLIQGGTNPTLSTIVKLAEALEIEVSDLFQGYSYKKKGSK